MSHESRIIVPSPLRHSLVPLVVISLVCVAASATIWLGPGILNTRGGGDSPFLLVRTYELAANLRAGAFPARWMSDAAYGLGYPFFNFYASLPYYVAAGLNVIGVDVLFAIKATQTLGMFAAGFAMWVFARGVYSPPSPGRDGAPSGAGGWGATLAACAYVLAPFHLVNVYVRGDSLSEFWAFVWYPLILLGVERLTFDVSCTTNVKRQTSNVVLLSLSLAALVLTHNVSAVLFAPFIIVYALAHFIHRAKSSLNVAASCLRGSLLLVAAASLALALSAWFWLPALSEAPAAQLGDQTAGYFNYANHFRSANLVQASLAVNYAVNDALDAFAMGLVQTALVVIGIVVWGAWRLRAHQDVSAFSFGLVLALFALATFMITPLSAPMWEHAPLLKLAQFPWRMLSVQAVFAAVLTGGLAISDFRFQISDLGRAPDNRQLVIGITVSVALAWSALAQLPNDRLNILSGDVTPRTMQLYEWYTGNIGTTIRAEYLPATVQPRPYVGPGLSGLPRRVLIAQDGVPPDVVSSQLESQTPARQVWRVNATQPVSITLPLVYTPAWQARINGTAAPIAPYAGSGLTALRLPQGAHRVELTYSGTPAQTLSARMSLIACLVLIALLATNIAATVKAVLFMALAFVLVWLVSLLSLLSPPARPDSSMNALDFQSRPFPHRGPIAFEGDGQRYELVGASVTPHDVKAGEPFTLTLQWRDGRRPAVIEVTQETPMGGEWTDLFRGDRQVTTQTADAGTHSTLRTALPGPQLLKLIAKDQDDAQLQARDPDGNPVGASISGKLTPGVTLLGPTVTAIGAQARSTPELVVEFANGIALTEMDWFFASAHSVCLRPQWTWARRDVNRADALQVSMRLRGDDGRLIAQADAQPQAGLAPTWSWPDGAIIRDSQCVSTVASVGLLNAGEAYTIEVVWYRLATLEQTGVVTLRGTRATGLNDLNVPEPMNQTQ